MGLVGRVEAQSDPGPYEWHNVQMIGGGFVDGIVSDPAQKGLFYARTDVGGAYRLDLGSRSWVPITDFVSGPDSNLIGIESIGIDPTDANRVYLAAGTYTQSWAGNGAIFRSLDQGRTWHRTDLPIKLGSNEDGRFAGERLAVDPNCPSIVYLGTRKDGLWRSIDFGGSWKPVESFPDAGDTNGIGVVWVTFDSGQQPTSPESPTTPDTDQTMPQPLIPRRSSRPRDVINNLPDDTTTTPDQTATPSGSASIVYCGVSTKHASIFSSTDNGGTWLALPNQPLGLRPNHGVMAPDGTLYITYGDTPGPNGMSTGAVWKVDTHNDLWTDITPVHPSAGDGFGYGGLTLDARKPNVVTVTTLDRWGKVDGCLRSTDGGTTWTDLKDDAVQDWSTSPWITFGNAKPKFGWWMGALAADPFDSDHLMYGTGATIWECKDASLADQGQPTHWSIGATGIEEIVVNKVISPPSGAPELCAAWDVDGFRNADLGQTPSYGFYQPSYGRDTDIAFAYEKPGVMARVASQNGAAKGAYSLDSGLTWTAFPTVPPGKGDGTIAVSSDGSTLVWSEDQGTSYQSPDLGQDWVHSQDVPDQARVVADTAERTRFYAFDTATGTTWDSIDGGKTFDVASIGLPKGDSQLAACPAAAGDLWLANPAGLYHSTNGGKMFTRVSGIEKPSKVGFGKAASGKTYPAVYVVGFVDGTYGFYRSDDDGASWTRINDDEHQFGWISSITGDPRVYGRVYVGTGGRGVLYGDPLGSTASTSE